MCLLSRFVTLLWVLILCCSQVHLLYKLRCTCSLRLRYLKPTIATGFTFRADFVVLISGQTLELHMCTLLPCCPCRFILLTFGADFRIALVRFITLLPLPFRFSSLSGQTLELRLCALLPCCPCRFVFLHFRGRL